MRDLSVACAKDIATATFMPDVVFVREILIDALKETIIIEITVQL